MSRAETGNYLRFFTELERPWLKKIILKFYSNGINIFKSLSKRFKVNLWHVLIKLYFYMNQGPIKKTE